MKNERLENALKLVRKVKGVRIVGKDFRDGKRNGLLLSFSFELNGGVRVACFMEEGKAVFRRDVTEEAISLLTPARR